MTTRPAFLFSRNRAFTDDAVFILRESLTKGGEREHGTYTKEDKIKNIAEVASKRTLELNSKAAEINQEIDRLAKKSKWSKEDEKRNAELNKQRIEAEKEANAFSNEWRKWKAENNVPEPEHFKRVVINL